MNSIVADGPMRFARTEAYQARRPEVQQDVSARYAARLAEAGFLRRLLIRYLRRREFQQELRKVTPSPVSCWFHVSTSRREEPKSEGQENV